MKVLIVEDDELIAVGLQAALAHAGHRVECVGDGQAAQEFLDRDEFDLVVLDLGLPGKDGFQVLADLRRKGIQSGVFILSARGAAQDRIHGLDLGADDYLTKPFERAEFLARVRAIERRRSSSADNLLKSGKLALDLLSMTVSWSGAVVDVGRREWMLLRLLLENPNRVYTRDQIQDALYSWNESTESNAIDVHVHHIRRKLQSDVILTVRGTGYRLGRT